MMCGILSLGIVAMASNPFILGNLSQYLNLHCSFKRFFSIKMLSSLVFWTTSEERFSKQGNLPDLATGSCWTLDPWASRCDSVSSGVDNPRRSATAGKFVRNRCKSGFLCHGCPESWRPRRWWYPSGVEAFEGSTSTARDHDEYRPTPKNKIKSQMS